ncbi:MAG: phosphonate ABC transporter ATP-binding protein [Chloroflexi bacterium]|nr:phosphonate ABC transporter ATP-binding protein [Chloroflexota bacterium]
MFSVRVDGLRKVYKGGVVALDDVSFAVKAGDAVAIIGPSGAGKTTLFRALTRTIPLDGGRIELDGVDLYAAGYLKLNSVRKKIGLIYQNHNLVPQLTALHNAGMGAVGRRSTLGTLKDLMFGVSNADKAAIEGALDHVGLIDKVGAKAAALSGGEQQRVAIARLLIQDPAIILADEPAASVDPASASTIMEIFTRLNREEEKTVICNLHDIALAKRYFKRVLGISAGRLVFDESPDELTEGILDEIYLGARENTSESRDGRVCNERLAREGFGGIVREQ